MVRFDSKNQTSKKITESMIEPGVSVTNSLIHRSTLLCGTSVENESTIDSCLIGRNVRIGSNVTLRDVVVDHGLKFQTARTSQTANGRNERRSD